MTYPTEHLEDSEKLTADGYVDLFEIELYTGAIVHLKHNDTLTWQGNEYEGTFISLTGVGSSAEDEESRPQLKVYNPVGAYSTLVRQGEFDGALVTRVRVLREHIDADTDISRRQSWRVRRIMSSNPLYIIAELRDQLDGQFFLVPGRMFIAPEFPQVSLA